MPSYLTKSDFKASYDCATKLFYRKNGYPTNQDDNEYLRFLADGGFMIELAAKAKYPSQHDLVGIRDPQVAYARTIEIIRASADAVVYEAAALSGLFQARIDILRRRGDTLELIEVKSSSLGADDENNDAESPFLNRDGEVLGKWREYLLDVTFQLYVARLAFPEFKVVPRLCVVNKAQRVSDNETLRHFHLTPRDKNRPNDRPTITYTGNLDALAKSSLLTVRAVDRESALLMEEVRARADTLASLLQADGTVLRVQVPIADNYRLCRTCEYRFGPNASPARNGFAECWGEMAGNRPHILDLHRVGQIGGRNFQDPVPDLLRSGRASLLDLAGHQLGADSAYTRRRVMQWSHHRGGATEHLPDALVQELVSHQKSPGWPLHFIDFEACDIALPHHPGLRPYERVAFQWSCHTVCADGTLDHGEWINTQLQFPNFQFVRSLRARIGDFGTVYVWSPYEQATLNRVLLQIGEWIARDEAEAVRASGLKNKDELIQLCSWIDRLLGPEDAKGKRTQSPRICDLHGLALEHYFHPEMLGRTSIKVVLPAVWRQSESLRSHPWFRKYLQFDAESRPIDPYKTLPALPMGGEGEENDAVRNGTGAIRVYQQLLFESGTDAAVQANRERLLLQYCELDTAAMVMIWHHWINGVRGN